MSANKELFNHMAENHNLLLLETEEDDIRRIVLQNELPSFIKWYKMSDIYYVDDIPLSYIIECYLNRGYEK